MGLIGQRLVMKQQLRGERDTEHLWNNLYCRFTLWKGEDRSQSGWCNSPCCEIAELDVIHTRGQSPLLAQLTLCGYCQLLLHISCQASCDVIVFKCQPIKSHVSWLMQHVSTNSRSECVWYSTHTSAYTRIVCAQYGSSLHLSVVRRRWYVRWEFTFVQISEQTKQICRRQTFDFKCFLHMQPVFYSPPSSFPVYPSIPLPLSFLLPLFFLLSLSLSSPFLSFFALSPRYRNHWWWHARWETGSSVPAPTATLMSTYYTQWRRAGCLRQNHCWWEVGVSLGVMHTACVWEVVYLHKIFMYMITNVIEVLGYAWCHMPCCTTVDIVMHVCMYCVHLTRPNEVNNHSRALKFNC